MSISVTVEVVFTNNPNAHPIPSRTVNVLQGTTGFKILELASQKNPSFTFEFKKFSFGDLITSINGVKQDPAAKLSWLIYKNGVEANVGIDELIPSNGDILTFKYEKY